MLAVLLPFPAVYKLVAVHYQTRIMPTLPLNPEKVAQKMIFFVLF